ncbi:hypothetical protein [Gordonia sp. NPDC003422]
MIPTRLLPQQLTYKPVTGYTSAGAVYGAPLTVPARVEFVSKVVLNDIGDQVVTSATIYLQPSDDLPSLGDLVSLPDGSVRPVIAVNEHVGARTVEVVSLDVS